MQRQQLQFLDSWLRKTKRKPLIIRGARQVGKSTLVELFARQQQLTLRCVNLERHLDLTPVFLGKEPKQIIQQLEFLPKMGGIGPDTLLFLDEIQSVPESIPALRYFYEDMPVIP